MSKVSILIGEGRGIITATYHADCACIDINACETWDAPLDIAASDPRAVNVEAILRQDYGWVKTKQWSWLCAPCVRALRSGNMSMPEED